MKTVARQGISFSESQESFPAIYTTLSPQALVELVLQHYHLSEVDNCILWHRGLSDIYLIESAGCAYILRISHHHWRSQDDIEFELSFLDFLHHHDFPVAHPIRTVAEDLFVTIPALEGDRYAALFSYAEGSVAVGDFDALQGEMFGTTLGELHLKGREFQPSKKPSVSKTLDLEYLLDNSLKKIAPFLAQEKLGLSFLENKIVDIKAQLAQLPKEEPYWGVCWGDPHSGNVHFTDNNQLTLFDFDQCGYGWRAFDLAKFLQVSLGAGISRRVREAFFAGYKSINSLSEVELDCLQPLTQTAHIWNWAINIEGAKVHCWSRLDRGYFRRRLEELKRLDSPNWQLF